MYQSALEEVPSTAVRIDPGHENRVFLDNTHYTVYIFTDYYQQVRVWQYDDSVKYHVIAFEFARKAARQ